MPMKRTDDNMRRLREPRVTGTLPAGARFPRRRLAAMLGVFGVAVAGACVYRQRGTLAGTLLPVARAATPAVAVGKVAPEVAFTTVDGAHRRLSEFRGRPVMLWLFATWCPTCVEGTASLAGHYAALRARGLQIIQLGLYENLGHTGPSVEEIAKRAAGKAYPSPGWLFGTASRESSYLYDPRGIPDRYFLIDGHGILRHVGWAPGVSMDDILAFVRHEAG